MKCNTSSFHEKIWNQPYRGWYYQQDYLQSRFFLFYENIDDIAEVVEDIVECVDENVEDQDIIRTL